MEAALTRGRRAAAVALLLAVAFLAQGVRATDADAATHRRDTMLALTNGDRSAHGERSLSLDLRLSRYAKRHSREMAERGGLFHTRDLVAKLDGLDWSIGGENIGVGASLDRLERAFMGSQVHRDNILQQAFDHTAIGVYRDGDGDLWVTVIFYG